MTRLRVASANLLHGMSLATGRAERTALAAAAEAIAGDVVGIQEVDRSQERSSGLDQTAAFAAAADARWWRFVPALRGTPGAEWTAVEGEDVDVAGRELPSYGVGLVSRLPVRAWFVRRFPAAPWSLPLLLPAPGRPRLTMVADEPRVAVAAVLDTPAGTLTVVTAHLSFVPGYNVRQLRALSRWARTLPGPRLLIGDFNLPGSLPRRITGWSALASVATYPAGSPRVQFDHVLGDGVDAAQVRSVEAIRLPISDHLALAVDLEL